MQSDNIVSLVVFFISLPIVIKVETESCDKNKKARLTPDLACVFPSKREHPGNEQYTRCQYDSTKDNWWCPTSNNYCVDRMFKWCPRTESTYGGTAPGQHCHFPFMFEGKRYTHCTKEGTPRLRAYYWCATKSVYDEKHWTRCDVKVAKNLPCIFRNDGVGMDKACSFYQDAWRCRTEGGLLKRCESTDRTEAGNDPGQVCHFPFYHRGTQRFHCQKTITQTDNYEWCATTLNFDEDHKWTRCKRYTSFKLEGVLFVVVIVGSCLTGIIVLTCLAHYICNPLVYVIKRRWRRKSSTDEPDEDSLSDQDFDINVPQPTIIPSAPPIPQCLPPSYDEVLLCDMSSSTFFKLDDYYFPYACQDQAAMESLIVANQIDTACVTHTSTDSMLIPNESRANNET